MQLIDIDALEGRGDAELSCGAGGVGDLSRMQQGLGRDASAMQTGAADRVLIDQDDRQPQLCGTDRGGVSARAAAEDDDICFGHDFLLVVGQHST